MRKVIKRGKRGRPPWIPPDPQKVEALAARGLSEEQIAHTLGISQETLIKKKYEFAEFAEAIKKGKAKGIAEVSNRLFTDALQGNTTAQIFFLKVRGNWREHQVIEHSGVDGKPITLTIEKA